VGLLKLLGLSTVHEGQHVGGERGQHAGTAGKHVKKTKASKKITGKK